MSQPIVIKSYLNGITLVCNPDASYEEILGAVKIKFQSAEKFFQNARLALTIEGKTLSDDQTAKLVEAINESGSCEIVCVISKEEEKQELFTRAVADTLHDGSMQNAEFYHGNIRSGQELICSNGVIICGDVHPGGTIVAAGNVVVLGSLKGTAIAGSQGNVDAFVVALSMDPVQIQIGDVLARNTDRDNIASIQKNNYDPQIATVYEQRILIESLREKYERKRI